MLDVGNPVAGTKDNVELYAVLIAIEAVPIVRETPAASTNEIGIVIKSTKKAMTKLKSFFKPINISRVN